METIRVMAFVDWDTARRVVPLDPRRRSAPAAEEAIRILQDHIADVLADLQERGTFRVTMRFYHGWHRGKTRTPDRQEFEQLEPAGRKIGRVAFSPEIKFGNDLLCGGRRCPLYDTLRRREDGFDEQKMVDTSLISDLLYHARSNPNDLALIVGDDDDLLPGVFTAEAWGARVRILRLVRGDNYHLKTDRLIVRRQS